MKSYKYTVCRASGEIEKITVPAIFDPYEIAHRLQHSLVFLHIPKGSEVYTHDTGKAIGPCEVLTTAENGGTHYQIPQIPIVDEHSAYHCYKNRF